jgi:hypothetical protein
MFGGTYIASGHRATRATKMKVVGLFCLPLAQTALSPACGGRVGEGARRAQAFMTAPSLTLPRTWPARGGNAAGEERS